MLRNYLIIAYRNLWRNKGFTLISSLGLALGISCSLLLFLLIDFHLSYDQYHSKVERIFRINSEEQLPNGDIDYSSGTPFPMAEAVKNDFPELEAVSPIYLSDDASIKVLLSNESKKFHEDNIVFTTEEYLQVFDVNWLIGNKEEALKEINSVVLTESIAKKYFGNSDPINRDLILENKIPLKVTGLIADAPNNSSIPYSMLISYATNKAFLKIQGWDESIQESWNNTNSNSQVFVLLPDGMDKNQIETRLTDFVQKYIKSSESKNKNFTLQPLKEVHFDDRYSSFGNIFSPSEAWSLTLVGFFLVIIASLNFINLSTSQAIKRGKEVGIRKVLGGQRKQLILQFMGETTIIVALGILISLLLVQLVLPYYNQFLNAQLSLDFSYNSSLVYFLLSLLIFISLMSGAYPAFLLSVFQPAKVLKSNTSNIKLGGFSVRRGLVGFQFGIAQILIVATIVVVLQNQFLSKASLGFNKEAIVLVPLPDDDKAKQESFKNSLLQLSEVNNLSLSLKPPASDLTWSTSFVFDTMPRSADFNVQMIFADNQYLETYGLTLLAGRMVQESDTTREFVVNEKLLEKLNIGDPNDIIGKTLSLGGTYNPMPIVGVVKDFHQSSFRESINPILISTSRKDYHIAGIKLEKLTSLPLALENIEERWNAAFPDYLYEYKFLDEEIAAFYEGEKRMSQLLAAFSGIAILIGCVGLYALVAFNINQRLKEVGIRKVLGASENNIAWLFSKEFIKLVVLAFAIAAPIAAFLMNEWLQNYAYKISLSPFIFLSSLLLMLLIAGLTVGIKSLSAAKLNPVDHLGSE